jgi:hypothetical protein
MTRLSSWGCDCSLHLYLVGGWSVWGGGVLLLLLLLLLQDGVR